ncbi:MAG: serine hydrolase domain-containing protein [Terriglobia bacterium]|jgi:CubicO group peptidase (beta-lactamase class C family)
MPTLPRTLRFLVVLFLFSPLLISSPAQEPGFQASFDGYVKADGIVGAAYVMVDQGQISESHNIGMADLEANQPVDSNTIFHWASITKTLTAIAVMQLRDRGKLSLDDPIIRYVSDLARLHSENNGISRVTLRHLLSHTAGFQSPTWPYRDEAKPWQPFEPTQWEQLVAMMPYQELAFAPGTRFQYSNPGFIYLAHVIEALTGDPYQVYVQKNILTPLGMTHSYYNTTPYHLAEHRSNNYTLHVTSDGHTQLVANGREFDTGITTPNSGLNAPLNDLARWVEFLSGNPPAGSAGILSRKSLEEMWKPVVPVELDFATAPPEFMGLSFFLYPRGSGADAVTLVGHTGHQAGFAAFFVMNPRNGRAVIANFNTSHSEADRDAYGKSNLGFSSLLKQALKLVQ